MRWLSLVLASLTLASAAVAGLPSEPLLEGYADDFLRRGRSLRRRGRVPEARVLLRRALEIRRDLDGLDHPRTAAVLREMALLERAAGNGERERELFQRHLALRRKADLPAPSAEYPAAESPFREPAGEHRTLARARNQYGEALRRDDRSFQAEDHLRRAWRGIVEGEGPFHEPYARRDTVDRTAVEAHRTATRLYREGRMREAQPLLRRALRTWELAYGPHDPRVLECRWRLAKIRTHVAARHSWQLPSDLTSFHPLPRR